MNFHVSFTLNDRSFKTTKALLNYCKSFSEPTFRFLNEWFNENDFVEVQTSGSTGKPKTIRLQKKFMRNSAIATGAFFKLKENTTALVCLSPNYIAGKMMLVRALVLGWHIDVVEAASNPLTKTKKRYDFSAMVPMQLQSSLPKIKNIKKLIVGGGIVSEALVQKIQSVKTVVFATYGMTETITHIAVKQLNHFSQKSDFNSLFYKILPGVQIYIDQRKCLVIAAPTLSSELIVTNDVVQLLSDKKFEWLGRFDNVINSGGIKLHPEAIEKKLAKIITSRFFVAGIEDALLGEKLILVIEGSKADFPLSKANLLKFEAPKQVCFVKTFIVTKTNKIQRQKTIALLNV